MILYVSPNKLNNLLMEMEITESFVEYFKTLKGEYFRISGSKSGIEASFTHEKGKNSSDIRYVLDLLKSRGKLKELSHNMKINNLSYISTYGTLEYIKCENGYTASMLSLDVLNRVRPGISFFDDDLLCFRISINHEQYDEVKIKCTAGNIQVFGESDIGWLFPDLFNNNSFWLKLRHSGDPGILIRKISVECVFWVLDTNPNDRSIIGSPLIISC